MLKIWGRANSSNVKKVLWCAEELGLPYERIDAGGAFGLVNEASYRARNPNGLVPCIDDDGFVLWESNTIIRYLSAKCGSGTLYPTELQERAKVEQWMDWTTSFATPFRDMLFNLIRLPEPERDVKAMEAGIRRCAELFTIADAALAERSHLGANGLSMADIALGPFAYVWLRLPIERPDLPNLKAWNERMEQRPAYRKIVMIPVS